MCSKENVMKCKSNYTSSYLKVTRTPVPVSVLNIMYKKKGHPKPQCLYLS